MTDIFSFPFFSNNRYPFDVGSEMKHFMLGVSYSQFTHSFQLKFILYTVETL